MKIFQPLCVAVLALSAYAGNVAASALAVSDDSLAFNNMTDNPTWETPDLPYARLLTQHTTLNATPRWLNAGTRQSALAPPAAAATAAVQQPNVPPPVPEASMVSMLLVGLGLLALSMHGEKQEKFDG
ncbi:hypothetical protein AKG95_03855 [Janthinobacterium lividum]|uniref:PEP-CTERM protein-sorting domain-containing protein n=1 Tax=Janthinobacterium lividum TaxID=29581 RepID=A0A1S1UD70_9BURK|nr:hypothetical protein [Janthinobacterium lividum]OHV98385.1 hypothetical protein AKG95_03855 [Janthinobacterium lividum]